MLKLFTSIFFIALPTYVTFQHGDRHTKAVYSPFAADRTVEKCYVLVVPDNCRSYTMHVIELSAHIN